MIGAVSQFGKLGLTVIGNGHEQVDAIYEKTIAVLDHETRYGRPSSAEPPRPLRKAEAPSSRHEFRDTIAVPRVWPDES